MTAPLPRLFVIGSSTTLLFGPHLERMVRGSFLYSRKGQESAEVARAFQDLDIPQGASAGDSAMVAEYLRSLDRAGGFRADVVLMHVGTHDIKRNPETGENQVPLEAYRRNVETIAEWFGKKGIRLVWLRGGPLDEKLHNARSKKLRRYEADLDAYNEAAEEVLARHGVPVLDLAGFTRNLGPLEETLKDHVHFKDDVVQLQAAFIAGYLAGL